MRLPIFVAELTFWVPLARLLPFPLVARSHLRVMARELFLPLNVKTSNFQAKGQIKRIQIPEAEKRSFSEAISGKKSRTVLNLEKETSFGSFLFCLTSVT
jgi:hypothetical protein